MLLPFRSLALITAALGLVFQASPAFAQTASVEARLKALEAEIAKLRSELAIAENPIIEIENIPQNNQPIISPKTNDSSKTEGFKVGNTTLKFGGFVDLDVHLTNTSDGSLPEGLAEDAFAPAATPVGDGTNDAGDFQLDTSVNTCLLYTSPSPRD